jgi:hypothetical protein
MPINPQTISYLLSLCPICEDIQYKILMLIIGLNGTPSSLSITLISKNMKIHNTRIKYNGVFDQSLSCYCRDLSLFNYLTALYPEYCKDVNDDDTEDEDEEDNDDYYEPYDKTKPYLPDFLYDIRIAHDLYWSVLDNDLLNEYKEATKVRLNKMIEEDKPYNI